MNDVVQQSQQLPPDQAEDLRRMKGKEFITKADTSVVAILATNLLSLEKDLDYMKELSKKLDEKIPNSSLVYRFKNNLITAQKLQIGKNIPAITFTTTTNERISASNLSQWILLLM